MSGIPRTSRFAPTWVFDLDNTLHDANQAVFPHISRAMTAYVREQLQVDEAEANRLRMLYWQRYGATLLGLVRHHGVNPHHFLWHTHQFPGLSGMTGPAPGLRAALQRLPGKKFLFSNAPAHYSRQMLEILGLSDLFTGVFCIEHTGIRPKPDSAGYRRLFHRHRLVPQRCIMVEDTLENLRVARRFGMRTVWVTAAKNRPSFVDVRVKSVHDLSRHLARLR